MSNDMLSAAEQFMLAVSEQTEKFLADYADEHHDDDPAVVSAYCDGFRECSHLLAGVVVANKTKGRL